MTKDMINMRVELDPETDLNLKKMARHQERAKRQMGRRIIRRVVEIWKDSPDTLKQLQIIQ